MDVTTLIALVLAGSLKPIMTIALMGKDELERVGVV